MNHHLQAPSPLRHRGFVTVSKESLDGLGGFVIIEESLDGSINEQKRREPLALSPDFVKKYRDLDRKRREPFLLESRLPKPPAKFSVCKFIGGKSQKNRDVCKSGKCSGECLRDVFKRREYSGECLCIVGLKAQP